ncbi:MAG: hypothetical protein CMG96_10230 [Marinovum sp.]|nr:hypothetical protein [Marinovum sp.]
MSTAGLSVFDAISIIAIILASSSCAAKAVISFLAAKVRKSSKTSIIHSCVIRFSLKIINN